MLKVNKRRQNDSNGPLMSFLLTWLHFDRCSSFYFEFWTCYWVVRLSNRCSRSELLFGKKRLWNTKSLINDRERFFVSKPIDRKPELKNNSIYKHFSQILSNLDLICCFSFSKAVRRSCSVKRGVLQHFAKITWKHQCRSFFLIKVSGLS